MEYVVTHLFFVASALFPEITEYNSGAFKWARCCSKYHLLRLARLGNRTQQRIAQLASLLASDECWSKYESYRPRPIHSTYEGKVGLIEQPQPKLEHMIGFRTRNGCRMCTQMRLMSSDDDGPRITVLHIDESLPETHRMFGIIYSLMHTILMCRDNALHLPIHVYIEGAYNDLLDTIRLRYESMPPFVLENTTIPLHRIDIGEGGEYVIDAVRHILSHAPIVLVDAQRTQLPRVQS